jgi:uncharacterized protein (TIGR00255 family)
MSGAKSQPPSVFAETTPSATPRTLRSMTGYAQTHSAENGFSLRVSVRAVNHRFLDLHLRVPEGFEPLEPGIRRIIRERVCRGHLDVTLRYERTASAQVGVNPEVAGSYLQAIAALQKQFGLNAEPDLATVLRLPGVIGATFATLFSDDEIAELEAVAARCLTDSLDKLDRMREQEGDALRREMSARLSKIADLAARVAPLAERARPAFAKRFESRLKELLGETPLDPARLAQEAAMAAERGDVSEELARLRSHLGQFESLLTSASDVGKKLDFLLQEMQREVNTLLSKTSGNDSECLEIIAFALEIKSEVEKIREQVQNIE